MATQPAPAIDSPSTPIPASLFASILKRDGSRVPFDPRRIERAIAAAGAATGEYDPTEALSQIRTGLANLNGSRMPVRLRDAFEEFIALDEWLTEGGHAPIQWEGARRGRPPLTEDGYVNHDIPLHQHGTRTGYNHACRCLPCRAANRNEDRSVIDELLRQRGWA